MNKHDPMVIASWQALTDKRRILIVELHDGIGLERIYGPARVRQLHVLQQMKLIDLGPKEERVEVTQLGHDVAKLALAGGYTPTIPEPAPLAAQRKYRGILAAFADLAAELQGSVSRLEAEIVPYIGKKPSQITELQDRARGVRDGFMLAESIVRAHLLPWGYVPAAVDGRRRVATDEEREEPDTDSLEDSPQKRTDRIERKAKAASDPATVWKRLAGNIRSARRIAYYYVLSWCSQPGGFYPRAAKHRGMLGRLGKLHLVHYVGGYAMLTDDGETLFRYLTKSRTSAGGRRLVKLGLAV